MKSSKQTKAFLLTTSVIALNFVGTGVASAQALPPAMVECPGTQTRAITCLDFRGNTVPDHLCDPVGMKPVSTRPCTVPASVCGGDGGPSGGDGDGDPLIFDLDGNGIQLLSAEEGVLFDIDNDGEPNLTGWIDNGDGFLAIDENGNGMIDGQSELFGTSTTAAYRHLADYDSNADGKINDQDRVWEHLKMWNDANTNGLSEHNELLSMEQVGMKEINLDYNTVEEINAGHRITGRGQFTRAVEGVGDVVDDLVEAFFRFFS